MADILSPDVVDELQTLLREGQEEALSIFLRAVRPEDVAEWLEELKVEERHLLVAALDDELAGEVLADTSASIRNDLLDEMDIDRLARITEELPADDAADLLGDLEKHETEAVLEAIDDEDEVVLRKLLSYPEDTAGGLMNPEIVTLPVAATVDDAIQEIRRLTEEDSGAVLAPVWVVDELRRLVGFVRLRTLVMHQSTDLLVDLMDPDLITVEAGDDQEEVADIVEKYDFVAVPVINPNGVLLGAVTVDDILDVIEEEATEDFYRLVGSSASESDSESVWHIARYRLPWLVVCLLGTQMATSVMQLYQGKIELFATLSVFTPAIMAMGGNTSLQSATVTVRRLALATLPRNRFVVYVIREVAVALVLGIACGILEAVVAVVFGHDPMIGVAIGAAMAAGMTAASLLGAAMPLVLDLAKIDPAVASGPLVSTINDSLGLVIYFTLATAILIGMG